jgi:signal transduction histidine kinase
MVARTRLTATTVRASVNFLVFVQTILLACTIVVGLIVSSIPGSDALPYVGVVGVALVALSALAIALPWKRIGTQYQVAVAVADLVIITLLCEAVLDELPSLSILTLVPVLWLSYSFGLYWALFAVAGNGVVALLPYLRMGRLPNSAEEWGSSALPVAIVAALTIAVHVVATRDRNRRTDLINAYEELRVSVALGIDGDEKLRVSVAEGVDSAEALRVSVAEGADSAEALRVSVAEGADSAEALRVSVAEGVDSAEALRVSVAEGLEGAEALRVSVAEGADSAEALRVSVAENAEGAEALRLSVIAGLASAKALEVSVEEGAHGAEALRISIAEALDAASTALTVVDTVDAGITYYDPNGAVMFTNETARNLLVTSRSGDSNHSAGDALIFENDRVTPVSPDDYIFARARRGELVTRRSYRVGVGTSQRAIMATSQNVRRVDGVLIGTVVATHDVTLLADAIAARDQFLTTVSHELRTPLTSMIGYLELIEDSLDLGDAGIANEFSIVQRNSQRLLALITDLLATAEGQSSLERRSVDISEIATTALNSIRNAASAAQITVISPALAPINAEVDAERVGDVLDKVLSNAVKFNRPGGSISLSTDVVGRNVVVRVTDTGIGMSEQDLPYIFDRFFRGSTSRSGEVAGTGLGLSTARLIVKSHQGEMRAESALGDGTTIEIELPLLVGRVIPTNKSTREQR